MKNTLLKAFAFALIGLMFASCGTSKNFILLNDINLNGELAAPQRHDLKIKKGDNLRIVVTHHDPAVVRQFNQIVSADITSKEGAMNSYVVNSTGYVMLPFFDSMYVVDLTCDELSNMLVERLEKDGIAYGASVSVKFNKFKVTIIGETGNGVYEFEDNGATILDLVAKANIAGNGSDRTRRDKILVMREVDSVWQTGVISLLSTDLFKSPFFYLQQNDVLYIYPTKTAVWKSDTTIDYWVQRISIATGILSVLASAYMVYRIRNM